MPTNTQPVEILADVDWQNHTPPNGLIFDVRVWSVARTQAQIRQTMLQEIGVVTLGLVAEWRLRGDASDAVGIHDGSAPQNGATFSVFNPTDCSHGGCFLDRFTIVGAYQV
jgi:hypothetical protein